MVRHLALMAALVVLSGSSQASDLSARAPRESAYRDRLCAGMRMEVTLANGARADCISDTHAIEVDFSEKWAEALGQSLLYAAATDRTPGIFLICRTHRAKRLGHRLRLDEAIAAYDLPVDVWPVE